MRNLRRLALVALAALVVACKTTKLTDSQTTITKSDSTYTETKNLGVKVPGFDLGLSGNLGSRVVFVPVPGKPGQTEPCVVINKQLHSVQDLNKIRTLQLQVDSLGNYTVNSSQKEHELQIQIKEKTRIIHEKEETIKKYVERETWFKTAVKQSALGLAGVFAIVGIVLYLFNKFRPKPLV